MADNEKNKFWAGDDGSEEDIETSDSESESEVDNAPSSRWAVDSDSGSDDSARVVKTEGEKTTELVEKCAKDLRNKLNINDWNAAADCYKKLKEAEKKSFKAHGERITPFLRSIKLLQETLGAITKPQQKKFSKANSVAVNKMRNDLRDYVENFQKLIDNLPEKDDSESDESDSDSSDSDSDSSDSSSSGSEDESSSGSDDDDSSGSDDDSEQWDSSSSSESESDSDEELTGRARWVKKAATTKTVDREKQDQERKNKTLVNEQRREKNLIKKQKAEEDAQKKQEVEVLSPEQLDQRMLGLVANRGKKGVNRYEQIREMRKLVHMYLPLGPKKSIPALMHLISASFDVKTGIDEHMPDHLWKQTIKDITFVVRLLNSNENLRLGEIAKDDIGALVSMAKDIVAEGKNKAQALQKQKENAGSSTTTEEKGEEAKKADEAKKQLEAKKKEEEEEDEEERNIVRCVGDVCVFMERLDDEYEKMLRHTDANSQEYVDRLGLEIDLVQGAKACEEYYLRIGNNATASRLCLLRIEHVYYKHSNIAKQLVKEQQFTNEFGKREYLHPSCWSGPQPENPGNHKVSHPGCDLGTPSDIIARIENVEDFGAEFEKMCAFMYQYGNTRGQRRAMICQIYHYALHDKFYKARDLLLMSRLQDSISQSEIDTQIMFNRMMVQLGFSAFRAELIAEAHGCLQEICGNKREKELLAQGLGWRSNRDRNLEQESIERRRLVPYHMHINLELLDATYLTSAMLLEIPYMASVEFDLKGGFVSKQFRRLSDNYADQVFTGPPENAREHVLAAAQALKQGEWEQATTYLLKLSAWNLFTNPEQVRSMLKKRVKDEALRTYMLTYSSNYDSIKQSYLCDMFQMDKNKIHSIISKMMINGELNASWDQPTGSIVLHQKEPTHLQALALHFADKVSQLVEGNERLLNFGTFDERGGRRDRDHDGQFKGKDGKNKGKDNKKRGYRGINRSYRGGYSGNRNNRSYGSGRGSFRPNRNYNSYGGASQRTDRTPN